MNGKVLDFWKKWDRSIIFIITIIAGSTMAWTMLKTKVDWVYSKVDIHSPKIEFLEKKNGIHDEIHRVFEKKLDRMDEKLDKLLQRR